jgi:hypothetical protein
MHRAADMNENYDRTRVALLPAIELIGGQADRRRDLYAVCTLLPHFVHRARQDPEVAGRPVDLSLAATLG